MLPTTAGGVRVRQLPRLTWSLARDPLDTLAQLVRDHGDLVEIPVPGHRVFLVTRPEHVERVLVTREDGFARSFTYRPLRVFLGAGLITVEGEEHARQRRLVQPLFSHQQVAAFAPMMAGAAWRCLESWDGLADGSTVDAAAAMSALALDVVGRTLFGADLAADGPAVAAAVTRQLEVAALSMRNPLILVAPELGLRTTPGYRRWAAAARTLDAVVTRTAAARRAAPAPGEPQDLLDVLLGAGHDGRGPSERQLRDEMMTFLMAGHETTSTALAWALALLSTHPEARERLAEEVDSALGGSVPTAGSAASLAWTRAVVQEALRLYPPLWTIERDAVADEELDGVAVPAGSTVVVSPYLVHRNPDVWPNPEGFQPERFLPEAAPDRHRLAFIPFGAGRRGCIGRGFALLEATIALAMIAQRWELDLLPGSGPLPEASVTLRPRGGLPMTLRRRRRADGVPAAGARAARAAPLGRVVPRRRLPGVLRRLLHDPLGSMTRLLLDHGDVVELPFPGHRVFVLARPEHVEHVLVARQDNYTIAFTYRLLKVFLGSGMITAEGEEYARQRRLVQPLFGHQRVAALAPLMVEATGRSLRSWDRLPDGSTLDAAAAMSALTLDIVGRALFGADLTGAAAAVLPAVATLQRAALPVARNPLVWLAPRAAGATTPSYWRYAAAMRTLHGVVTRVMAERRAAPAGDEPRDVLDVLLGAGPDDRAPAERQVRDEMMTFFMAGHETTANALAWTLALLSIHPGARERLGAEVDAALGGRVPTAEDAASLVWTRAVLQEAMRLYPPVWTIERDALEDDELDGVAIPAGSTVVVSPYLVHRNPDVWPDPEGFRPERFLPEAAQARHRLAYVAFGAGQRGCVGRGFALLEAAIALAMITQRYRLDLAPGVRPVPEVSVTLRPRGGLPMTLRHVG